MTKILSRLENQAVVVGSGLAGLLTALSLAPTPVVLVTRSKLGAETSSAWAQGGIAASLGDDDHAGLHIADTLAAGHGLCDEEAVRTIITQAPDAIAMLERFGVRFDRDAHGKLVFGLEAAHGRRRIVHVGGDGAGAAIVKALIDAVRHTPSITVLEGVEAHRLLVDDHGVCGLLCSANGVALYLKSRRAVLATGGIGGLFEATTNPAGNFGQGIALAARAGAVLADMEFVQFHPTALDTGRMPPSMPLPLVSEALRGEGAILINEKGERFMAAIPGAELAPRDVVARAIASQIRQGGHVFLDARKAIGTRFPQRFPAIDQFCRQVGVDATTDPIPVTPAVHYHMGGVATDLGGRSSLPGLWVAGEAACTGLHGANRLASNSLLEAAVMGARVGADIQQSEFARQAGLDAGHTAVAAPDPALVRPLVSRHLGILRHGAGIDQAVAQLLPLAIEDGPAGDPAIVALLVAVFAANRRESRGSHARTDFPGTVTMAVRQKMTLAEALDRAGAGQHEPLARSA
ncbi:L-aspartate oxidase [Pararhizobium sp.]|uniref:L-aspartate oxidase n=1 Tax=Pararhizobium sp. TaxID=1977563 RepID=UPI0027236207|nr:L-aspartate oxidase [Pararhizobium sp.]MDO9415067.1 L-aspartate oxidase [Pararhizobium sp.]